MSSAVNPPTVNKRLVCVDALRGFDMLWIIGGGEVFIALSKAYPNNFTNTLAKHFDHEWGQFYFYDLIMPLFLFIVGVVMPVAFKTRLEKGVSKKEIYKHVFRRVVKLYILGLIASGHLLQFDLTKLHLWTDTLHAIAAGYLVSSVLILEFNIKKQIAITATLLLIYWICMTWIPIPGVGAGFFEKEQNLALYIDDKILGRFQEGYGWTYILTNMTFICSVMLGSFAGRILLSNESEKRKVIQLFLFGTGSIVIGLLWSFWFPVIHHLWTSTLVLFAGGLSCVLLGIFYLIIDVWGYKKWAFPFVVIGVNAIAVYVATHLFDFKLIGNVFVGGLSKWLEQFSGFVQSLAALIIIWLILYWMYKKKTFIKV